MPDPIDPPDGDDDDTIFDALLDKRGPEWLKKQLAALGLNPEEIKKVFSSNSPAQTSGGMESFLRELLAEQKSLSKSLQEKLDGIMEILTPEQRTLLKSPKDREAPPSSPASLPRNAPPENSDAPTPKPKRKWLK